MKVILAAKEATLEEMLEAFLKQDNKRYNKQGSVKARVAKPGEVVETVIEGEVETTNTAKVNDVVVQGPSGESYVMSREKFESRYADTGHLSDEWLSFKATGSCYASPWTGGQVSFIAPWGEPMILNTGDYLCSTRKSGKDAEGNIDVYRIEQKTFANTYTSGVTQ